MKREIMRAGVVCILSWFALLAFLPAGAQTVSFGVSTLQGGNLSKPTSLQFGPDGRLYVAEQYGKILVYTITRNGPNNYQVTATEEINLIAQIPNHNDDGTPNPAVNTRQVTGIVVAGTATNPVIYVTSSDPRIGGGNTANNDKNLDTNSGIISRLTWDGTQWIKLDLVRGLPRSEENHSPNGLAYDAVNNVLYMAQGGNTNMGAPSNNFAYLPEYAYSTAILKIDLNAIGNTTYDLPTLDDETRPNDSNGNDINDPFGGNDGLNQARLLPGSPVTIYSPGWRNNYDIVITRAGRMYSFDNGPNGGWGGPPINCTIQPSEPGTTYCDGLHYVSGQGYYAGFPNPVRANRNITFNTSNPQSPVPAGMENPIECNYIPPGSNGSLTTICSSTNGLCEYKASNFNNAMKGDLLAVAFNGKMYRFKLNATGNALVPGGQTVLAQNFGSIPLDVTAQGDNDIFPGTIWVAMYGANNIVVFEPNDFVSCSGDPMSMLLDDDGDGYKNGDETQNGTDKCSQASVPADFDNDFLSNLLDPDDDNDGIPDTQDKFAQDPYNGLSTFIPVRYTFENTDDGGIGGWGFTGMMTNYTDDYLNLFDMDNMTVGGAAYKFTIDNVPAGDALGNLNNQKYAYQFGVNTGAFPFAFEVSCRVMAPFAGISVSDYRSMGMSIGTGDQDNYLKIVCAANGGAGGIEIVKEINGIPVSAMFNAPILGSSHVNLYLQVDPTTNTVQPFYSINGGAKTSLGSPLSVPASWLNNVLAVGFITTSRGSTPFSATWDFLAVDPIESTGNWVNVNTNNTCTARHECAFVQAGDKFYLMGGRGNKPVEIYDFTTKTWSTGAPPPIQLHHFQAVELNGLIYVVCAFTGNYPNETPVPNIYIYDPLANTWHVGPEIPANRRRGSAGAVVHNGKIYIVSGLTNGHVSGWVPYLDKFDPVTNTWTVLPNAPRARDHFQVALHDNKIYAIGGRLSGYGGNTFATTVAQTDVYDIFDQSWTTLPSPEGDIPTQRAACAVAVLGDEILAIGGESMAQSSAHAQTEALNVNTSSWRTLDDLNTGRHGTQAIVNNHGVYIVAGSGNRGGSPELNSMEAFYLYGETTPTGTPYIKGSLAYSPSSLQFGQLPLGHSSTKTITCTNTSGTQALLIQNIALSSSLNYAVSYPHTLPFVVNPGDSFQITVIFSPTSAGVKNATLTVTHNATNGATSVINLSGEALSTQPAVRINAGGMQHTTAAGEVFSEDNYYTNYSGSVSSTSQPIDGTTEDTLYQTERWGPNFAYNIPVINGTYTVKLHFSEIWSGASNPGVRIFDVLIEGVTVIDDLDLYSVAGMYNAYVRTFTVSVNDQIMNIQFIASVNNAKVSAIEIIPATVTQGMLIAAPSSITFPATQNGTTSSPASVTLTNTGVANLTVNTVAISGSHASEFSHTFTGPLALAPGSSTTFNVFFTPSASGTRNANLTINHTGGNPSVNIPLTGTGTATSTCGYFVELNGLLIMEVESATPAEPGWTLETNYANYTGSGYYTWTGPEYLNEKGHGLLTYNFKINNPGKYRFKIRTRNGGTVNTHNNDVWVRFPDHGCTFEKNGQLMGSASGWWKEWQNNLNVWTYNTWAGESAFWEVYVTFPFPGIYTLEISGRTQLYSLDRIVLYRPDMMSDWAATSANPPQSAWENCPTVPLVWYRDSDLDYYGNPLDSVLSVSKPGIGWTWNKTDCDDTRKSVYPGAPELLDGRDNDCDGIIDEGAYLTALNINCGGSYHFAVNGDVFESDRLYSLPSSAKYYSGIGDILNTDDEPLYRSERTTSTTNTLRYDFKAQPGLYTVTFMWAEQSTVTSPGQRIFDVYVEDSLVINDLDIIAVAGYKTAYTYTHNFRLMDTVLNVKVVDVVGKAKINALKVAQKPNTPPYFTISGNSTFNEDFTGTHYLTITPAPVPPHEAYQVVTYSLSPPSVPFANVSINPSTGQVSISAVPNGNGQQQFTVIANDGYPTNNIATKTFTLKVNAINEPPAFTLSGNVTVDEDFTSTEIVTVTPAPVPADEATQTVTYSIAPASVPFANIAFNPATGQVSITSVPNASGSQTFTITADDGQSLNNLYTQTFTLTVNPVNDPPAFTLSGNVTVDEDFTSTEIVTVTPAPVPADEATQTVTYSIAPASVPFANIAFNPATGQVSITSVPNASGSQTFTLTANDGQSQNNLYAQTFTLTVNPVNDPPMFTLSGNVTVAEDFTSTEIVSVTPAPVPADEATQTVTYSIAPASVPFANIAFNPATGQVSITSLPDASGSQTFTITADDGQSQNNLYTQTFTLTVNPVNDPPAFTLSGNVTVDEDFTSTEIVTVTPAPVPADETSQVVSYSIAPASVSFANIAFNPATGQVSITSVPNASGSQTFTLTANDGQSQNNLYAQTFTLTVNPVNDPPMFTLSGNVTVAEDFTSTEIVSVTPAPVPADEATQTVTYSIAPASVPFANIAFNPATGQVSITSLPDASGSQTFTLTADDGQSQNNLYTQTFTLTVNPVNDPPAFTLSGNVTVDEDFTSTEIVTVTPAPVPADEATQTVTYSIAPASVPFANIAFNPATGQVSITSLPDASGSQTFTLTADDGQSLNNLYTQTFTLTVNPVNDPPVFTLSGDVTVDEDFTSTEIVSVTPAPVPADEATQTVTYSIAPASVPFANIAFNPATGQVSITSLPDASGSQTFTITADDGQSQNNLYTQTFTLTVNPVNDPPAFTLSGNVTVDEDFTSTEIVTVTPAPVPADETSQVVSYSIAPASVSFANIAFNPATGQVSITSVPNASGSQTFTLTANDGQSQNNLYAQTFTLTVNPVNDPPMFTLSGDVTLDEDFTPLIVSATPNLVPPDETGQIVTYSISPAAVSFAHVSINSQTGEILITAVPDASGSQTFVVIADDGESDNNIFQQSFTLTVNPVNDPPAFSVSGDLNLMENFSTVETVTVYPFPVPADEQNQVVMYSLTPASVSFANVSIDPATGTVTVTSVPNQSGVAVFTITANDGGTENNLYSQTFVLSVGSVNSPPVFTVSGNVIVDEDFVAPQVVTVTPNPVPDDESGQTVIYSLSPSSVNFANVSFNPSTGEVTITAVPDANGTQVFTITADDGQSQNNLYVQTFTLTVNPVNDPPMFTLSGNVTVAEDFTSTEIVSVTPAPVPADETGQIVTYAIQPSSVTFADISFNTITGEVVIQSLPDASGSQTFTLTANDGQSQNNLYTQTFTLTVNPVNDPPTLDTIHDPVAIFEDAGPQWINLTGISAGGNENQPLNITVTTDNPGLFASLYVSYTYPSASGSVHYQPAANQWGSALVTITVDDGQASNNTTSRSFTVVVLPVNDAPVFSISGDVTVDEDFTSTEIVTVTPAPVPADEATQTVTYSITPASVPFANITFDSTSGQVTITAIPDAHGSQVFTIIADDGQPQNNIYAATFTLTVLPVNDPPIFTILPDQITVTKNFAAPRHFVVQPGPVPADEASQMVSYSLQPNSISFAHLSFDSLQGVVTFTSLLNATGSQTFTITADDGQNLNNLYSASFSFSVIDTNYQPTLDAIADPPAIDEDAGMQSILLTGISAGWGESQHLSVSAVADSAWLFTHLSVSYNSPDSSAVLYFMPAADRYGSAIVTVTVDDGQPVNNTISRSFHVVVNPVNDAPAFDPISNPPSIPEDAGTQYVFLSGITAGPYETQNLSITAVSDNPALIPHPAVNYSSPDTSAILSYTPLADAFGTAVITVTVEDGQPLNNSFSRQFTVTVLPVNDAPMVTDVYKPGQEDKAVGFHAADFISAFSDVDADTLQMIRIVSLPAHGVLLLGSDPVAPMDQLSTLDIQYLTYYPHPDYFGQDTFQWNGYDGALYAAANASVFIHLNPVNDIPVATALIPDILVDEDTAPIDDYVNLNSLFYDVEEGTQLSFGVVNTAPHIASVSIDATHHLDIAFQPNAYGIADVTITASDSYGSSAEIRFTITVNPVEDPPSVFVLISPDNGSQVDLSQPIRFIWSASADADADPVAYTLFIHGHQLDTAIAALADTTISFDALSLLKMDSLYTWYVVASDGDDFTPSGSFTFKVGHTTGIVTTGQTDDVLQIYPNPFETAVIFSYQLNRACAVRISIYNFMGQKVTDLLQDNQPAGYYKIVWETENQEPAGIYFYEIELKTEKGKEVFTGKLIKN